MLSRANDCEDLHYVESTELLTIVKRNSGQYKTERIRRRQP